MIRYVLVADTDAKAHELASDYVFEWLYWFSRWGFNAVIAQSERSLPRSASWTQRRLILQEPSLDRI
jgi:hypothetical protein